MGMEILGLLGLSSVFGLIGLVLAGWMAWRIVEKSGLPGWAGLGAILNAISAAVGDEVFRRAPVNADMILTSLENGRRTIEGLTAHI